MYAVHSEMEVADVDGSRRSREEAPRHEIVAILAGALVPLPVDPSYVALGRCTITRTFEELVMSAS